MRLLLIVCVGLLCSSVPALAQQIQSDDATSFALQLTAPVPDSTRAPLRAATIHYPVLRHTLNGTAGGAAIAGTVAGLLSVLCSSPSCPRMGPAIVYGAAFGAFTGAAVGAVSGLNTPVPVTAVASTSDRRSANR
jgi:hypothetical protein